MLLRRAESDLASGGDVPNAVVRGDGRPFDLDATIVRTATSAERQRLLALRADGTIGDAAFQRIEQELDWEELDLQSLVSTENNESS